MNSLDATVPSSFLSSVSSPSTDELAPTGRGLYMDALSVSHADIGFVRNQSVLERLVREVFAQPSLVPSLDRFITLAIRNADSVMIASDGARLRTGKLIWHLMRQSNLEPNYYHLSALLSLFFKHDMLGEVAWELLNTMKSHGFALSVQHYTSMMQHYLRRGMPQEALHVVSDMIRAGIQPDERVFSIKFGCYVQLDPQTTDDVHVQRLLDEGWTPTASGICMVLTSCRDPMTVLQALHARGARFNDAVMTSSIKAADRLQRPDWALPIVQYLRNLGVAGNVISDTALLTLFAHQRMVDEAEATLQYMIDQGQHLSEMCFLPMIAMHSASDSSKALGTFQRMLSLGIRPTEFSFTALLSGFVREKRVADVERLLKHMRSAGIALDPKMRSLLMTLFRETGDPGVVQQLFEHLSDSSHIGMMSFEDARYAFRAMVHDNLAADVLRLLDVVLSRVTDLAVRRRFCVIAFCELVMGKGPEAETLLLRMVREHAHGSAGEAPAAEGRLCEYLGEHEHEVAVTMTHLIGSLVRRSEWRAVLRVVVWMQHNRVPFEDVAPGIVLSALRDLGLRNAFLESPASVCEQLQLQYESHPLMVAVHVLALSKIRRLDEAAQVRASCRCSWSWSWLSVCLSVHLSLSLPVSVSFDLSLSRSLFLSISRSPGLCFFRSLSLSRSLFLSISLLHMCQSCP
jgi:pentatricopeptide repeat protein